MREMELFDALTEIDDTFILEAHEIPPSRRSVSPFGRLRRTAAVLAAAMVLLVTIAAADGDFGIQRPRGWVRGSTTTAFDMDPEKQELSVHDVGTYSVEGWGELPAESITIASATQIQTKSVCHGAQLQVIQEAMILMDDGGCEYKAQITVGTDEVAAVMDNLVDGEPGVICNVRCTVSVLTGETALDCGRHSIPGPDGKVWVLLQNWNIFLPTQLGYDYPVGVDFRFPDMQYNYDGRGTASK